MEVAGRRKVSVRMRKTPPAIDAFEAGRGPKAKECWQPVEAGKGKEIDFPLEPPERNAALLIPWF